MNAPRQFRRLRMAASTVLGLCCLLLVAAWVRSYWHWDQLYNPVTDKHLIIVESASGRVIVRLTATIPGSPWIWHISQELGDKYWGGSLGDWEESNRDRGLGGFAFYATVWNTTYRAPHWFLAVLFAALAAVPWLRWSKRFSLRTLLITITLVALVLGLSAIFARS